MNPKDAVKLSPERVRIGNFFKKHIDLAICELGGDYEVGSSGKI
jgi:hypothetical protein